MTYIRKGWTSAGQHDFKYSRSSNEMSGSSSSNPLGFCVCKPTKGKKKRRMWLDIPNGFSTKKTGMEVKVQLTQNEVGGHESNPLNKRFLKKDFPESKRMIFPKIISPCLTGWQRKCEFGKTYWRVCQRIPFWTSLHRIVASRPSRVNWPTTKTEEFLSPTQSY